MVMYCHATLSPWSVFKNAIIGKYSFPNNFKLISIVIIIFLVISIPIAFNFKYYYSRSETCFRMLELLCNVLFNDKFKIPVLLIVVGPADLEFNLSKPLLPIHVPE